MSRRSELYCLVGKELYWGLPFLSSHLMLKFVNQGANAHWLKNLTWNSFLLLFVRAYVNMISFARVGCQCCKPRIYLTWSQFHLNFCFSLLWPQVHFACMFLPIHILLSGIFNYFFFQIPIFCESIKACEMWFNSSQRFSDICEAESSYWYSWRTSNWNRLGIIFFFLPVLLKFLIVELYLWKTYFRIYQLSCTLLCGCCGQLSVEKLERVFMLITYLGKLLFLSSSFTRISLTFNPFLY